MANRQQTALMLEYTCAMWDDPLVYHYQEIHEVPKNISSLFMIGPSSREDILEFKWRAFAHHYLRANGFTGIIVVPEPRENNWSFKDTFPTSIVHWEAARILHQVTKVVGWIPRHPTQLPGRVTNTEIGFLAGMAYADPVRFRNRLIWGYPKDAWKVKSEEHWVGDIAGIKPFHDLDVMCAYAAHSMKESN